MFFSDGIETAMTHRKPVSAPSSRVQGRVLALSPGQAVWLTQATQAQATRAARATRVAQAAQAQAQAMRLTQTQTRTKERQQC